MTNLKNLSHYAEVFLHNLTPYIDKVNLIVNKLLHSQIFIYIFSIIIFFLFLSYYGYKLLFPVKQKINTKKILNENDTVICWVRVNQKWEIIEHSSNLSKNVLQTKATEDFLNLLKIEFFKNQEEEIDLFIQYRFKIIQEVSGNYLINYIIHEKVNDAIMNINGASLPIKFYGKPNNRFDHLSRLPSIKLDIDGHFVNDGKYIYKKEDCCNRLEIFSKFASIKDYEKFWKNNFITNIKYLPMSFMILDKSTQQVLFMSISLERMFFLAKKKIENITDFIEALRGKIIPDSVFFKSYKDDFWNKISNVEATEVEIIHTLDRRLIKQQTLCQNNYIILIYEDISNQLEENKSRVSNEYLINSIENIIVIKNNIVEFSSFFLINIGAELSYVNKLIKDLSFCLKFKKSEDAEKIILLIEIDSEEMNDYILNEIEDIHNKKDYIETNVFKNCPTNLKKIPEMILNFYLKLFIDILKGKKNHQNENIYFNCVLEKIYEEFYVNAKIKDILLFDKVFSTSNSYHVIYTFLRTLIIYLAQQNDISLEIISVNNKLLINTTNINSSLSKLLIYVCLINKIDIKLNNSKISITFKLEE